MKRVLVSIGIIAAAAISPSVASAGTSPQVVKPQPAKPALFRPMPVKPAVARQLVLRSQRIARLPAAVLTLQTAQDSRTGQTLYRLGDTGLWMM